MTNEEQQPPCRLYFLLARDAPVGVIFRRGPSRWVELIKWNIANDTFEPGQWFKGRIYEKRCDLSPDGTKLVYFAQKINQRTLRDREYTYAWTAISRPPYLTALALWPKGDCWNGGGLFETNRHLWLNHHPAEGKAHADHEPHGLRVTYNEVGRGEDDTVLAPRLTRDGWRLLQAWKGRFVQSPFATAYQELKAKGLSVEEIAKESVRLELHDLSTSAGFVTEQAELREKPSPNGTFSIELRMDLNGFARRCRFSLRDQAGNKEIIEGARWADWDQRGRLAFVRGGKLWVAEPSSSTSLRVRELAEFNGHTPVPVESPMWARQWS
jgi:hypothetical protein